MTKTGWAQTLRQAADKANPVLLVLVIAQVVVIVGLEVVFTRKRRWRR